MPENLGKTSGSAGKTSACLYETAGELCGKPAIARGYCRRHYKALHTAGAFKLGARLNMRPDAITAGNLDRNLGHIERARIALEAHTEALVQILIEAARNAAKKGDSRPAEWALLHARAFEPVLTGGHASGKGDSAGGVKVIIGVQLGQGPSASPAGASTYVQAGTGTSLPINLPAPLPAIPATIQNAASPNCLVNISETAHAVDGQVIEQ